MPGRAIEQHLNAGLNEAVVHFQKKITGQNMLTTDALKVLIIEGLNFEDIEPGDIGDSDPLFGDEGLGLDSVDAIELTMVIEKEFGVKVTNIADAESIFATVTSLCDYINAHKNA
jgi:acyl carrier protein